ncbi:MAG TPA: hypothetical protein VHV31_02710 [Nitrolancea sp.]|nr:hypothetical protein [Nitrolancea sp.]
MAGIIEFHCRQHWDGHDEVELRDILSVIEQEGRRFIWVLRGLWVVGKITAIGATIRDLMDESENSNFGVRKSWDQLVTFADHVFQAIDGTFEAYRDAAEIPSSLVSFDERRAAMYASAQIVIEALDSTLWSVFAQDEVLLGRVRARFGGTDMPQ